jgi:hypothetical protein
MALSGQWVDLAHRHRKLTKLILDVDSSVSETYGHQEGSAYNGYFACTCYHPPFLFNQFGDLERVMLRRGNHPSAKFWRRVLLPSMLHEEGCFSPAVGWWHPPVAAGPRPAGFDLVRHAEHIEHLAADLLLDAWTGAKLLLKLTQCNIALLALCNEGETAVEEARDDAAGPHRLDARAAARREDGRGVRVRHPRSPPPPPAAPPVAGLPATPGTECPRASTA